jgi:hypothetical protein
MSNFLQMRGGAFQSRAHDAEATSVEWTVELERRLAEIAGWSSQKRECLLREREASAPPGP